MRLFGRIAQRESTHEPLDGHADVQRGTDRSLGLVFATVFFLISLWPLAHGSGIRFWSLAVAIIFVGISIARPKLLRPLNQAWFHFGMRLNRITSPIVMGLLFFSTFTPTALILRLLGKDPLLLKLRPDSRTYWIKRAQSQPESMTKQF